MATRQYLHDYPETQITAKAKDNTIYISNRLIVSW